MVTPKERRKGIFAWHITLKIKKICGEGIKSTSTADF
jgi:hypothetical protein